MSFRADNKEIKDICIERSIQTIGLRNQKRSQIMNQKRRIIEVEPRTDGLIPIHEMECICEEIRMGNVIFLKNLLNTLSNDPVPYSVIKKTNIIGKVISFLKNESVDVVFCALSVLINYSSFSKENSFEILKQGLPLHLQSLIQSNYENIVMHTLWLISNICSDGYIHKQTIVNSGIIQQIPSIMQKFPSIRPMANIMWMFCNLVRRFEETEIIESSTVQSALDFSFKCINSTNDEDIVSDACWTIQYVALLEDFVHILLNDDLLNRMSLLCQSNSLKICVPSIRFFGNLFLCDDPIAKKVLPGILPVFIKLSDTEEPLVLKELYYSMSNITASKDVSLLNTAIESGLIYKIVPYIAQTLVSKESRIEMEWMLSNFCFGASNQMLQIVIVQCPELIAALFRICSEQVLPKSLLSITLKAVRNVCTFCDDFGIDFSEISEELMFEQTLEDIIVTENDQRIKNIASYLLENYFRGPEMKL